MPLKLAYFITKPKTCQLCEKSLPLSFRLSPYYLCDESFYGMVTKQSLNFEVRGKTKRFFRYARNGDPNGDGAAY
jgi:hypothetical protein